MDRPQINKLSKGDIITFREMAFFVLASYRPLEGVISCAYLKGGVWVYGDLEFKLMMRPDFIPAGTVRELISIFMPGSPLLDVVKPSMTPQQAKNKHKANRKKRKGAQS